ncbi:hypothetical protein FCV25MIE_08048 [Fagus crenata]
MNQRVEHLEHTVTSLVTSQQQNLKQITELFTKLNTLSSHQEKGETSHATVALASFHLEGDAQLWFQLAKPEMGAISRNDFKEGLHSRYGPTQLADYFRELTKLQQTSTIKDYHTHFEKLLAKVGHLPQGRQVSCFISSLHDSIKADVLVNRSTTLTQAIELARLCEAQNLF